MDREKVIEGLEAMREFFGFGLPSQSPVFEAYQNILTDTIAMLKEQEAVEPKTIPEELKLKMWNALYAEEDKFEKKCVGTKEQDSWFLIYRPWLQEGFNLAIKAIADWEGR